MAIVTCTIDDPVPYNKSSLTLAKENRPAKVRLTFPILASSLMNLQTQESLLLDSHARFLLVFTGEYLDRS